MTAPTAPQSPESAPIALRSVRTFDVDDQAASLAGWHQQYQQMSAGPFEGHTIQARLSPALGFLRESTNRRLVQRTAAPDGTYTFALVMAADGEVRLNDQRLPGDALLGTPGACELQVCVPERTALAGIEVSVAELEPYAAVFGADLLPAGAPLVTRTAMAPLLRGFMDQVLAVCTEAPQSLTHERTRRSLKSAAISNLLLALSGPGATESDAPVASHRRYLLVQQARAHIDAHLGDVFTVADVCRELGVSRRTLQYCFEDVLQINPIAYIRAVRLNAARRDLKRAAARGESVADVASRWGFWHLGHFSTDYRRMFGEPPSATLAAH